MVRRAPSEINLRGKIIIPSPSDTIDHKRIFRNLSLYRYYRCAVSAMAWLPIFFLYFSQILSPAEVLLLESIYYFCVVSIELPSGLFSDRFGRRVTLITSALSFVLSYALFFIAGDFLTLVFAQILLAAAIAFESGSDASFHYENLKLLSLQDQFLKRESTIHMMSLSTLAIAIVVGGVMGQYDLRAPYAIALLCALVAVFIAWSFFERPNPAKSQTILHQFRRCLHHLRQPLLRWLLIYSTLLFAAAHAIYEFYQPYLVLMLNRPSHPPTVVSAIYFAISVFVGALAASLSYKAVEKMGLFALLFCAFGLQLVILGCLSIWLSYWIAALLVLRNVSMDITHAPIVNTIAPLVSVRERASYLSLQSLSSRLCFALLLGMGGLLIQDENTISSTVVRNFFSYFTAVCTAGLIILVLLLTHKPPSLPSSSK